MGVEVGLRDVAPETEGMTAYSRDRVALAPVCLNCRDTRGLVSLMKGPLPDPTGREAGLIFVCDTCQHTMKDRRSSARREEPK